MAKHALSHLDRESRPAMVDVGGKEVSLREALAEARIKLPRPVVGPRRGPGGAGGPARGVMPRRPGNSTRLCSASASTIVIAVIIAAYSQPCVAVARPSRLKACDVSNSASAKLI
jgi:hypothetical protein